MVFVLHWNWMEALWMVAPFGIESPANRSPTVWFTPARFTILSTGFASATVPADSSASSALTAMGTVRVVTPSGSTVTVTSSDA